MPTPLNAACYARTSTEEQREKQTIQSQISALEAEIKKSGDQLVERYIDDGCSGALLDRPALDRLRADARNKQFQKLYIYSPDRLARELILQLLIVKELRRHGIEVVFLSQKFGDSPSDQLLFQMLGAISEFERAQILERTRRGRLHKAKAGILIGSIPKFGYICTPTTATTPARYEINTAEAQTVREIFRLFTSPLIHGLRTLARELHRLGLKNRSGNTKWAKSSLAKIIGDPTYIGTRYYNKYAACEPRKAREDTWYHGNTSVRLRPKAEWLPTKVPPLVTEAEFAAAQQKLARNRELCDRNAKYEYLIKGLACCGCGKRMYGYPCHGQPRYKCADKYMSHPLPKTCHQPTIVAARLDKAIWNAFLQVLDRPAVVATAINYFDSSRNKSQAELAGRKVELERQVTLLKEQEKRLLDAYEAQAINVTQLKDRMSVLSSRRRALAQEIQGINESTEKLPAPLSKTEVSDHFALLKNKAQDAPFAIRQEVIRLFVKQVTVTGRAVMVQAFLPPSVSVASPEGTNWGRNSDHSFEIRLNLETPANIEILAAQPRQAANSLDATAK